MVKNHKLVRAINDANWIELVRQLEYKAEWYGRELIKIDQYFRSSKNCSNCGHIVDKLPVSMKEWHYPECGSHYDCNVNASINILAAGLAVPGLFPHGRDPQDLAGKSLGATVRPKGNKSRKAGTMKQKPPNITGRESRAVL